MKDARDAERLIDVARARLMAVRASLEAQQAVDLTDLGALIAQLMRALAGLPRDHARPLRNKMVVLFDELDRLGRELRAAHAETGDKLRDLAAGRHAAAAYSGPPRPKKR